MKRHKRAPESPLPQIAGIDPVRLRLPGDPDGTWPDLGAWLTARYAGTRGAESMARLLASGRVLGAGGRVLEARDPYEPGAYLWFHRDMPAEPPVPFPIPVVYRDGTCWWWTSRTSWRRPRAAATSSRRPWPGCARSWTCPSSARRTGWTG